MTNPARRLELVKFSREQYDKWIDEVDPTAPSNCFYCGGSLLLDPDLPIVSSLKTTGERIALHQSCIPYLIEFLKKWFKGYSEL
jgi:hypothetical protein